MAGQKKVIVAKYEIFRSIFSTTLKNRIKIEASYAINQFEPVKKQIRTGINEDYI